jgi:hypothetical protein
MPLPNDPFNCEACDVTDVGHADRILTVTCAAAHSRIAELEREKALAREEGTRMFPGFSLRESPIRVQRLGFAWIDQKKQHRLIEFANVDSHPLMVANQLRALAEAIEEAHTDPKSPLGRLPV